MLVAASTDCFASLPLADTLDRLADLEYSSVEIAVHEGGKHLTPSRVADDLEGAIHVAREAHRLNISGYSLKIAATGEEHYRQFSACCRLAKATKVVLLTIPSAELGTPFNEEVEHLRKLVNIASVDGILVGMRNLVGCLSQDVDTVTVMCDHVKGLGLTLDPSHLAAGPSRAKGYDPLLKYTYNVYLRDSKKDQLQVRVGQGELDYTRLITALRKMKYNRALTVHIAETPEIDHNVELRKMRLLLETLL